MLAFPSMLIGAAQQAGMKVPPNPDDFEPDDFPHFHVFCNVQLGRRMAVGEHWDNAKVVAAVPEAELRYVTLNELIDKGLSFST